LLLLWANPAKREDPAKKKKDPARLIQLKKKEKKYKYMNGEKSG